MRKYMKNIGFVILIICFLTSCKTDPPIPKCPIPPLPDNILYHDLQPDSSIHSIRYFIYNMDPNSCGDTPVPADSSSACKLDINGDSINDFNIYVGHFPGSTEGSIHCVHVVYVIGISGLNAGDSISFVNNFQGLQVPFNYDTINNFNISHKASWSHNATIQGRTQGIFYGPSVYFNVRYIGVKVNNNYGWILVAPGGLNGIKVKEYAINLTDHNSIKAGQKN
jgi:hypothetical protein